MYLVTDQTTEAAEALRSLAKDLEPLFFDMVKGDYLQAGLDIRIPAQLIADKYHIDNKSPLAFMYAMFCRGFIEGAIYQECKDTHPETITDAINTFEVIDIVLKATEEELEAMRSAVYAKLGKDGERIEAVINAALEIKRGGKLKA